MATGYVMVSPDFFFLQTLGLLTNRHSSTDGKLHFRDFGVTMQINDSQPASSRCVEYGQSRKSGRHIRAVLYGVLTAAS